MVICFYLLFTIHVFRRTFLLLNLSVLRTFVKGEELTKSTKKRHCFIKIHWTKIIVSFFHGRSLAVRISMAAGSFLVCQKMRAGQQHLLFGNYLSRTFLLLDLSVLRTFRQRGTPKWKKGEEQIKPDKNRHFLPLFPLRFPPLDSLFLNLFFPLFCRFLPALFS